MKEFAPSETPFPFFYSWLTFLLPVLELECSAAGMLQILNQEVQKKDAAIPGS